MSLPDAPRLQQENSASQFRKELQSLIQARIPLVHILTFEEDRAISEVKTIAESLGRQIMYWSASRGIYEEGPNNTIKKPAGYVTDLAAAIEMFDRKASAEGSYIFVILDPFSYLKPRNVDPVYQRRFKDFAVGVRTRGHHGVCLIVSPETGFPLELEKEVTVLDFPLPNRHEISNYIKNFSERITKARSFSVGKEEGLIKALVDACVGLTSIEIENAMANAVVEDRRLDFSDVPGIHRQKQQIVRKNGILEFIDVGSSSLDDVGGLGVLKKWLETRNAAFSEQGRAFGIKAPKGVLLTGVPGCGKSLSAKCVASSWNLPLLRLDMGKVFSSLVGESEEKIRTAIKVSESVAPCILWIDEIEKGIPRNKTGFVGDSGVSLRVMGSFLTWLQEKQASVFVFATANEIDLLAPEVLRKGRFDEIFFVDLPNEEERREIIKIHLRKVNRDSATFDLDELIRLSGPKHLGSGLALTGAEIESWVNESLINAFYRSRQGDSVSDLGMDDFRLIIQRIVPLAKLRQEQIRKLRDWANAHALSASVPAETKDDEVSFGGRRPNLWNMTPQIDQPGIPGAADS